MIGYRQKGIIMKARNYVIGVGVVLSMSGCASISSPVIPENLADRINPNLTFEQIKNNPTAHHGAVLELGGEVLSAKRFSDHTRLMVLQLPLKDNHEPVTDRTQSRGRFLAIYKKFLDPATVPPGTRITMVGELTGVREEPLDEMPYTYPTFSVLFLKIWPPAAPSPYWYPYNPYFFYWGPYWGRYWGPYPYWYWW